jgi:predicted branched-subunit amino acid permease
MPSTPSVQWTKRRREVLRESLGVGFAVGLLGISFGALGTTGGLTVAQTCALSILAFTGGSQFAFVGVVTAGGGIASATATAWLLGARNTLYGLRLAETLNVRGPRRLLTAQLVIDESTAVAISNEDDDRAFKLGFWATGAAVFILWNLFTLIGALLGSKVGDPKAFGLDAAVPAAFLALLWPRLQERQHGLVALGAAAVALATTPFLRPGVPVLLAGIVAVVAALPGSSRSAGPSAADDHPDEDRP